MQRLRRLESGRAILATSILLFSRICFVLPQRQLWKAPLPYSAPRILSTDQNPKDQQQRRELSLPSSSSPGSNNPWVLKSRPEYRVVSTLEAKKNPEPWRGSGLSDDPWVHESGLEYRDVATIEAARSVARFAHTNQYLGSFKTRRGEIFLQMGTLSTILTHNFSLCARYIYLLLGITERN